MALVSLPQTTTDALPKKNCFVQEAGETDVLRERAAINFCRIFGVSIAFARRELESALREAGDPVQELRSILAEQELVLRTPRKRLASIVQPVEK